MADPRAWLDAFDVKVALLGMDASRGCPRSSHPRDSRAGHQPFWNHGRAQARSGLVMVSGRIGEAVLDQFTTSMVEVDGGYGVEALMSFREEGQLDGASALTSSSIRYGHERRSGDSLLRLGFADGHRRWTVGITDARAPSDSKVA